MESNANTDAESESETTQTTLLTFHTVEVEDPKTGESREGVQVDVSESDAEPSRELKQYESLSETPELHEKIMAMAAELNVDTRVVDLPQILIPHTDVDGNPYVSDLNGVVRYYLNSSTLVTTSDYEDMEKVAAGTQRKNDLQEMYQTA